jgi:hypothetical protein
MAGSFRAQRTSRASVLSVTGHRNGFSASGFYNPIGSKPVDRSSSEILEEAFNIAWSYLYQTGELGEDAAAYLSDAIERMIRQGQRNRMFLANRALIKYRTFRQSTNVIQFS